MAMSLDPDVHGAVNRYRRQVDEAVAAIREQTDAAPAVGLILGTGLGRLAKEMEVDTVISYDDLPHVPISTVETHDGQLLFGRLGGAPVVAMQGRFHLYEGYTPKQVTFPVRVLGVLGVDRLLISNAAGGMNPHFRRADLMLITDHINFQGQNPLAGPNVEAWGPRFPDMSEPYDPVLRQLATEQALSMGLKLQQGIYVAVEGPNLETRAEYRMLRLLGADAVGMSTVPEVLVARHMGMRVLAISVITDECFPDALEPINVEDVLAAAGEAEPKLTRLMRAVVEATSEQVVAEG